MSSSLFFYQIPDLGRDSRGLLARRIQSRFRGSPGVVRLPLTVERGEGGLQQEVEVSSSHVYSRPHLILFFVDRPQRQRVRGLPSWRRSLHHRARTQFHWGVLPV